MSCEKDLVDVCGEQILHEGVEVTPIEEPKDFSACLGFGAKLEQKDGVVSYTPGNPPVDGVYDAFTIKDGCVTAVHEISIPSYTVTPCAPIPNPCDCDGSGGSVTISTKAGNLSYLDASGNLFTGIVVEGNGVTVTGKGTANNPLVITASSSSAGSLSIRAGNDGVTVSGSGSTSDPVVVGHKLASSAQRINGMSFDRFGHMIDYEAPSTSAGVKAVIGGDGITATTASNGAVTVELAASMNALSPAQLGGFTLGFDNHNIPIMLTREITFPEGTYLLGNYNVTVNQYGSLTAIEKVETPTTRNLLMRAVVYPTVSSAICRKLPNDTRDYTLTIVTEKDASFKIEVESPINLGSLVVRAFVDGEDDVVMNRYGEYRVVGLTSAVYAASTHSITINGDFSADTLITVTLIDK